MILQYTIYHMKTRFMYLMKNKCVEILTAVMVFLSMAYTDKAVRLSSKQTEDWFKLTMTSN